MMQRRPVTDDDTATRHFSCSHDVWNALTRPGKVECRISLSPTADDLPLCNGGPQLVPGHVLVRRQQAVVSLL